MWFSYVGLAPAHPYIYILFLDGVMQINLLYRDQLHYGTKLNSCCLADTPEMWLSTIMQTLCSVWNAISIDFHINRPLRCGHLAIPHLAWPQQYHRPYKFTLIVDSWYKLWRFTSSANSKNYGLEARYSATNMIKLLNYLSASNCHMPHLWGHASY